MFNLLDELHQRRKIQLLIGLLIGVVFGFLLQKGGVTNYKVIIDQLLLRDFTVVKVMLTAVIVGMVGIYSLKGLGFVRLHPKPLYLKGVILGGLIFGVGFGLLGYCPGTTAGALGTGSIHALFGIIGILIGAYFFSLVYPSLRNSLLEEESERRTIPEILDINPYYIILPLVIFFLVIVLYFE